MVTMTLHVYGTDILWPKPSPFCENTEAFHAPQTRTPTALYFPLLPRRSARQVGLQPPNGPHAAGAISDRPDAASVRLEVTAWTGGSV